MTIHRPDIKQRLGKHYADIRARLMNPSNAYKTPPRLTTPEWKSSAIHFDDHVKTWQWHLASLRTDPHLLYVRQRCVELGVSFQKAKSSSNRAKAIVHARRRIMWELRERGLTFQAIGLLFGGMGHDSAMYNVQIHQKEIDGLYVPRPSGINALRADHDRVGTAREAYENGMPIEKAALLVKCSRTNLIIVAREQGWYSPHRALKLAHNLAQMRRDYEDGMAIRALAKKHHISERTWGHIKARMGIPTRPHSAQWHAAE